MCSTVYLDEVKPIWLRSRIPIKVDKSCIDLLVALWNGYLKVNGIPLNRKNRPKIGRLAAMATDINMLLDISVRDVFNVMKISKSKVLLVSQHYVFYNEI